MVAKETENTLNVIRARECSLLTKDDFMSKRKVLADKLKHLFEEDDEDKDKLIQELQRLEQETVGGTTKSLIGKGDNPEKHNDEEAKEMANQFIHKISEDRMERKQRMRELKKQKRERIAKMKSELDAKMKTEHETKMQSELEAKLKDEEEQKRKEVEDK